MFAAPRKRLARHGRAAGVSGVSTFQFRLRTTVGVPGLTLGCESHGIETQSRGLSRA